MREEERGRESLSDAVRALTKGERDLWWERFGIRTEDVRTNAVEAGWAALDDVRDMRRAQTTGGPDAR